MQDHDANPDPLSDLQCMRCGYALKSLEPEQACPECGLPIRATLRRRVERMAPRRRLPRLRLTLACLLLATLTGAPGLLGYAGMSWLVVRLLPPNVVQNDLPGLSSPLLWLLVAGSLTPILTILTIPKGAWGGGRRRRLIGLLSLLGVGGGLIAVAGNPLAISSIATNAGLSLAALGCAIGLTSASAGLGSLVPGWRRMGAGRQTVPPMIGAILLIGTLRWLHLQVPPHSLLQMTMVVALVVSNILLAIGTLYLLGNRLWLATRLLQALAAPRER